MQSPFTRLTQNWLIVVLALLMVWIPLAVYQILEHPIPTGLPVHLLRPGVAAPRSPGIQPLLTRVVASAPGARPSLYIDFELVPWDDLGAKLHQELSLRPPNWPVYVEGDPDLEWRQVAEAIDAVRGQQGEVVLLTHRL